MKDGRGQLTARLLLPSALWVLAVLWVVPPLIHLAMHYCPVRPDGVTSAQAMPQFARKYGLTCSVCHTTVPSLTRAGYDFRRAGFRMPDEIGEEAKFSGLKDMYSGRIREEFQIKNSKTGSAATGSHTNAFAFHELTLYPVTGAIGKYWAAETELTFAPDEKPEVENAYIRATYPFGKDGLLTARAGIFHPFEGYGASDRPISNYRSLIWSSVAKNGTFDTKVKLFGQDQEGLELGVTKKDTTLSVAILNGYNTKDGGANVGDDNNKRDILVFANQFIGEAAAVSAEFLSGNAVFAADGKVPSDEKLDIVGGLPAVVAANPAAWTNYYQRLALYGNYKVLGDKFDVRGGYESGKDHFPVSLTDHSGTFDSGGWFSEARSRLNEHLTAGLRYDTFRPTNKTAHNSVNAVTGTVALPFESIKFLVDYQKKTTQSPVANSTTDDSVRLEWMVIF